MRCEQAAYIYALGRKGLAKGKRKKKITQVKTGIFVVSSPTSRVVMEDKLKFRISSRIWASFQKYSGEDEDEEGEASSWT